MGSKTMGNRIAVIDYGMGNLHSIKKALQYLGGEVLVTADPNDLRTHDRIVLPGIGAFGEGMNNLRASGFLPVLKSEVLEKKKPFLGICLGMQLLADKSFEFGNHEGLSFIPGEVKKFDFGAGDKRRIPHVGWNNIDFQTSHSLLSGINNGSNFYFVHSYHYAPKEDGVIVAASDYGYSFPAIIARGNIFAAQFHPEKSQKDGLKLLTNFLNWEPELNA